jgi:hypothetical protein
MIATTRSRPLQGIAVGIATVCVIGFALGPVHEHTTRATPALVLIVPGGSSTPSWC